MNRIPFYFGARRCIGLRFAMTEMTLFISMILTKFRVEFSPTLPAGFWPNCIDVLINLPHYMTLLRLTPRNQEQGEDSAN